MDVVLQKLFRELLIVYTMIYLICMIDFDLKMATTQNHKNHLITKITVQTASNCLNYDLFDFCDSDDLYFLLVNLLKFRLVSPKLMSRPISKLYASK